MNADILTRRQSSFVLWRVAQPNPAPELIFGQVQLGAPVAFVNEQRISLQPVAGFQDLWEIPAADCNLLEGAVYHYWFEVTDAHPERSGARLRITDPFAFMVDWRLYAPRPQGAGYSADDEYPAAVIKFVQGKLVPCDAAGESGELSAPPPSTLPPNNRMVIYELPTAWTRIGSAGEREIGLGTFRDVMALIDAAAESPTFADLEITQPGRAYLAELGINAIELLPPADSFYVRQWGYGTTNFFAPDFELGYPGNYSWPAPNRDLRALVAACHARNIRFLVDVVMAFSRTNPYLATATDDFFIRDPKANPSDPDAHNSRGKDEHNFRNGFGSSLFRYVSFRSGYDPISGQSVNLCPARQLMKASLAASTSLLGLTSRHVKASRRPSQTGNGRHGMAPFGQHPFVAHFFRNCGMSCNLLLINS